MQTDNHRERGKHMLRNCGFSETEISRLEEAIAEKSNNLVERYKNIMTEVYEFVFNSGFDFEKVLQVVNAEQIEWKNPMFNDIAQSQNEIFSYIENPFEVVEGMFTCPKCGNKKNVSYSKQVRSSDEGMSTFVFCSNRLCRHSWVYQG